MKNKIFCLICVLFSCCVKTYAEVPVIPVSNIPQVTSEPKPAVPSANFEDCVKTYNTSIDNLFYLTLAALSANKYKIEEIQSKTGYLSFNTNGKNFLISITSTGDKGAMIRITPMDNSYNFYPVIAERIFSYLTNNVK